MLRRQDSARVIERRRTYRRQQPRRQETPDAYPREPCRATSCSRFRARTHLVREVSLVRILQLAGAPAASRCSCVRDDSPPLHVVPRSTCRATASTPPLRLKRIQDDPGEDAFAGTRFWLLLHPDRRFAPGAASTGSGAHQSGRPCPSSTPPTIWRRVIAKVARVLGGQPAAGRALIAALGEEKGAGLHRSATPTGLPGPTTREHFDADSRGRSTSPGSRQRWLKYGDTRSSTCYRPLEAADNGEIRLKVLPRRGGGAAFRHPADARGHGPQGDGGAALRVEARRRNRNAT